MTGKIRTLIILTIVLVACGGLGTGPYKKTGVPFDVTRLEPGSTTVRPLCNRDYFKGLFGLIREAEEQICVVQFELNEDRTVKRLLQELVNAAKRGVEVKLLAESELGFNRKAIEYLEENGVKARLDSADGKVHTKIVIADGTRAIIGSTNWSYMSIDRNNETNILIEGEVVKTYQEYYDLLWKDGHPEAAERRYSDEIVPLLNRDYYHYLMKRFDDAEKTIDVCMYGMRYYDGDKSQYCPDNLLAALADAHKRKVRVRVVLEQSDYNPVTNQHNKAAEGFLEKKGLTVKWESLKTITHAKLVIIDGEVIVGSSNWGYEALRDRAETNLAVNTKEITSYFNKYFDRIWQKAGEHQQATVKNRFSGGNKTD